MTEIENHPNSSAGPAARPPDDYRQLVEKDLLTSFRFTPGSAQYRLMRFLFKKPLVQLAEFLLQLDEHLARNNVQSMACLAVEKLALGLTAYGEPSIPAEGPVLMVANHPGWIDNFVALAGITRSDVFFLADSHPILENLPHFKEHIIFVDPQGIPNRAAAIRSVIEHLKAGHVVVIFPKGLLEPDPYLIPGAKQSILDWNDSTGIFLNKVPETILQPMLISRMLHPKAWGHWALTFFKEQRRKQQLAMALQFAMSLRKRTGANWKTQARIDFGEAIPAHNLSTTLNPQEISQNIKKKVLSLLVKIYPNQA